MDITQIKNNFDEITDTDEKKIINQYIHDLEEKIKIMDYNYTKLNRKMIQVQHNYENMDILHDKIYSILTSEQKDRIKNYG
tara:strand:- start:7 stop:249 length:243 start_codon:yes stop_codon:yes gene_type:complete